MVNNGDFYYGPNDSHDKRDSMSLEELKNEIIYLQKLKVGYQNSQNDLDNLELRIFEIESLIKKK